jgi:hypothetical protein
VIEGGRSLRINAQLDASAGRSIVFRFTFALLMTCAFAQGFQQDTPSADSEREKDVYAIYSLMLTNPSTSHGPYTSDRLLIARTTGPGVPQEPCVRPTKEREADFREILADYGSRKATPRQLKQAFSISKPYLLLSPDEVKDFISARFSMPNPGATDERFRGVSDVITLSDVYFNQRGTLALTAISTWCGGLCASYQWKVFEKVDGGKWEERDWITCMTVAGNLGVPAPSRNEESAMAR